MSVALIVVDGVMRKLVGGGPIAEGIRLYLSLCTTGRVILLSNDDTPQLVDWLELNGCTKHDFLHLWPPGSPRVLQANELRRESYAIDLVVVPDPEEATGLIAAGFNTLLFTHSRYAQPSWRPDTRPGVQPWDDITQQVAALARMKAADERLKPDE